MTKLVELILPVVLSSLLGAIAALLTIQFKFKRQRNLEAEKENERIRLKILNPLLISSDDLLARIVDIRRRRKDPEKCTQMKTWFETVKNPPWETREPFKFWVNDEGFFAMSTLYITAMYLYYASKIRRDFPFIELKSSGETELLFHISVVRTSLGGKFGIWESMQDSLGTYLSNDNDGVKNYREFSELIIDDWETVWFNRLVDFFKDIDLKLDDHLHNIEQSLRELIYFLNDNLQISTVEYMITDNSISELKQRDIPQTLIPGIERLKSLGFLNEVDFTDALVSHIGLDSADDFKPSILKCAEKKRS